MNVIKWRCPCATTMAFQEFMLVPHGAPNVPRALRMGAEVFPDPQGPACTAAAVPTLGGRRGRLRAVWRATVPPVAFAGGGDRGRLA